MFSQALIAYSEDATAGLDPGLDGLYINDSQTALTTLIDNDEYAIQSRALPFDGSDIVPIGFKAATAGTYTISIDHIDGLFAEGQAVFLKDNLMGTIHELQADAYTFATEAGVFNQRFELVYQNSLGTIDVTQETGVVVYKQGNEIIINTETAMNGVRVYDISGRLIASQENINATNAHINMSNVKGLLLMEIKMGNHTIIRKVMN
jgi:hypothetical protein